MKDYTAVALLTEKDHPERSVKVQVFHCMIAEGEPVKSTIEVGIEMVNKGFAAQVIAIFEGKVRNLL